MAGPLPATWTAKVVGVTFTPTYPRNLYALQSVFDQGPRHIPLTVELKRNPQNEHDANAVEVHVPALREHSMIGHVPARIAERLAPELDGGQRWTAEIEQVLIDLEHEDRPGISIRCGRVVEASEAEAWSLI